MNPNVLFLDDCPKRTKIFLSSCPSAICVSTAKECIDELSKRDDVQILFTDHDLNGEIFVDPNREDCGMEVVRWICRNKPKIDKIIIHTQNDKVFEGMRRSLRDAGYAVECILWPILEMQLPDLFPE